MKVKIEFVHWDAKMPQYMTEGAAGADVYTPEVITLVPHQQRLVPLGFKVEVPYGYELQVRPRSGLALKHGLTVVNSPGTIDSDYRGEVGVILSCPFALDIPQGERIAQLVLKPVERAEFVTSNVGTTERGDGGFGSTN